MKAIPKTVIIVAVLICLAVALWRLLGPGAVESKKVTYSQFLQQVRAGEVADVVIAPGSTGVSQATFRLTNGNVVRTVLPSDYRDVIAVMQEKLVNIEIQDSSWVWLRLVMNAAPFLLLLGFWVFMMRRMPNGQRPGSLR